MTQQQLSVLQHALGVDGYGRGEMYRNQFCAAGGEDEAICRSLVALGLMREHGRTELFPYYNCSVTEAGKAAVRRESPKPPKLTRGQLRYREYLHSGARDAYDLSFGEWLKWSAQRRRAES